jgi:DNA-binding MarR family transcriptional regulator
VSASATPTHTAADGITSRARLLDELRAALIGLLGAERRLRGREQRTAGAGTLTNSQLWALSVLRDGEKTAGEIAEATLNNPATTTAMLDQLEERGVLERQRSTEDRRVILVSLTPKGRRIVEEKHERAQALWREMLKDADEEEIEAALRVMAMLARMLDAH